MTLPARARRRLWNANLHYHPVILQAIPPGAQRVVDVGCGDGILSAQLIEAGVRHVVGLDADADVLSRARARHRGVPVEWMHGDVFEGPLAPGSFDAVVSVAALHHMNAELGLSRFAELVRPGGVVAVIGLAANDWRDLPFALPGDTVRLLLQLMPWHWQHSAPIAWPPPATYREMKRIAKRVLPGVRYRRHLLGRYSLLWTRP
jgi:SAM-dependent methyltransferase